MPETAKMPLVLASTSPYRKALLHRLMLEFVTINPQLDETPFPHETAWQLVARLAQQKAQAVRAQCPNCLIIGSDQVAVLDTQILGKPGNFAKAMAQLQQLSGRSVQFLTGLSLLNSQTGHCQVEVVPFVVEFRTLTPEMIETYLHKEQPYDCAGSFKSEGLGIALFERLVGDDPATLMGLPLIRLVRMLEQEGLRVI